MARGDHIFVSCLVGAIPYQHHGIDMGDGTVIHLAPSDGCRVTLRDSSDKFSVRRDSLADFRRGEKVHYVKHSARRSKEETAATAERLLGKTGYSLLDGNCEHFASLCATGHASSHQIDMGQATLAAAGSAVTKAVWCMSGKLGTRLAFRSVSKVHPAALLADGVEVAVLAAGCNRGMTAEKSQRLARVSGSLAAAGIGAIVGGPGGAALFLAVHTSSTAVAEQFCKSARQFLS